MAPEYPPTALAAGKTAKVKVRIHIDATGTVTKVDVLEPVGDGFDEAAVAAALQYVFEPAEIDGQARRDRRRDRDQLRDRAAPRGGGAAAPPPPTTRTGPPNHAGAMEAKVTISRARRSSAARGRSSPA